EVAAEWHRLVDHMRQGVVPTALDLFAGYLVPGRTSLLSYLPDSMRIIIDQPGAVALAAGQMDQQTAELEQTLIESGEMPSGLQAPLIPTTENLTELETCTTLRLGTELETDIDAISMSGISDPPLFSGKMLELVQTLKQQLQKGW